ncbi:MAG: thiamine-phosphate kinase [Sneathiella sp.]|nr:thiamine-phosphate kinase [Sneathiella sp.]
MSKPKNDPGEFEVIKNILSPLAAAMPGSLGLTDDAALLDLQAGEQLVLTKDAMVAGVHFFANDPPEYIAKKLLRTNLSDLAAMGAKPLGYLLATAWTDACDEQWIKNFANGLKEDQELFQIGLLGGDTVKTTGPLTLSLTALGTVKIGKALRRNGAKVGDLLYVSGTLGDSALGLQSLLGQLPPVQQDHTEYLQNRYYLPQPRLNLAQSLVDLATSCLDISDGLLADMGHVCTQSNVGAIIHRNRIPLSKAASSLPEKGKEFWDSIVGGGDDYELAFTVPAAKKTQVENLAKDAGEIITHIGEMTLGDAPVFVDEIGQEIHLPKTGWTHF